MNTALATLTNKLASQFDMGDGSGLSETLKSTAFKSNTQVTDEQMTALLIVANQYGLNPFTREIFAFPDKGGIVPVVGVDGWSRIMNTHAQFDGMDFKSDAESCTCIIYRKDRTHPTSATEYMDECKRDTSPAWKSHPRRMLRHKAMIQAARLAFGFTGIYDQDEAERIVEIDVTPKNQVKQVESKVLPSLDQESFDKKAVVWKKSMIDKGDPYYQQCQTTTQLLAQKLNLAAG
ncbi:phage recombination protein Bet, partial [Nitrosomonas sp.]|uniref:phage recombination protein Bet n=1 Tax=Nitrosomonas sp. TaxID=42353 RepID=UPI0025CE2955